MHCLLFDLYAYMHIFCRNHAYVHIFSRNHMLCRNHDITMHKSDVAEKSEFLQDLDSIDVSLYDVQKVMYINDINGSSRRWI